VVLGRKSPSPDTGTYCRARAKLPEPVLRQLVYNVGDGLESRVPADWLWLSRHVKLVDGTTLLVVVTTLTDAERYPQAEIAKLFRCRWHVELDLRTIKTSLRLDDLRGKKPETVRREIWLHWLAYNLIRKVMAQAALSGERLPRELSFASGLSAVAGAWGFASVADASRLAMLAKTQHLGIACSRVGHRPDRVEPRAIKRHPKAHKFLKQPRAEARAKLIGACGIRC